jgi:hypothetical protein
VRGAVRRPVSRARPAFPAAGRTAAAPVRSDARRSHAGSILPSPRKEAPLAIGSLSTGTHTSVPFTLAGNHLSLTARIGGSRPLHLLLDTGTGISTLDRGAARELGLRALGVVPARDAGDGLGPIEVSHIPGLALGDLTLPPARVAIRDLAGLRRHTGRCFDGRLAFADLSAFVVEIDFPARTLRLHSLAGFAASGRCVTLDCRIDRGRFLVPVTLAPAGGAPVAAELALDTGAGGPIAATLSAPLCRAHGWPTAEAPGLTLEAAGPGLAGAAASRVGRLAWLGLDALALERPVVLFAGDRRGSPGEPGCAGTLGVEALRRGRVFIDAPGRRILIEPTASWSTPFEFDASGLLLECEGESLDRVRVCAVLEGSPAQAVGVRAGDRIRGVNGQPAGAIPLHRLRDQFARPGRRYVLALERDAGVLEVAITTRRLV